MSFWEKSISNGKSLFFAVSLIAIILIFASIVTWGAYKLVLEAYKNITASGSADFELNGGPVKIKFNGGKNLSVVTVPAYQLTVPSGVILDKKREIIIKASGLVSTAADDYQLDNSFTRGLSEAEKRIQKLEMQRDFSLSWRNPDGSFVYRPQDAEHQNEAKSKKDGIQCEIEASNKLKIVESARYGYLLAFVRPANSTIEPNKVLADMDPTFLLKIGNGATIKYNENQEKFIIVPDDNSAVQTLPGSKVGNELIFTINDTIIRNPNEITLGAACLNTIKARATREQLHRIREMQKDIVKKYMAAPTTPSALRYLKNKGFFTVNMLQQPPRN